jgi:hypothetical protein
MKAGKFAFDAARSRARQQGSGGVPLSTAAEFTRLHPLRSSSQCGAHRLGSLNRQVLVVA